MPMISSLFTLLDRQRVSPLGLALSLAAAIRSLRPSSKPADCGPRRPLPPENPTRSNPIFVNRQRFSTGGTSAAASINVGTLCFLAIATNSSWWIFPWGSAELRKNIIAVRSLIAFSSSSRVWTSISVTPALRMAWS